MPLLLEGESGAYLSYVSSYGKGRWRRFPFLPPLVVRCHVTPCLPFWKGEVVRPPYASPFGKGRCRAERDGGDKKVRFQYGKFENRSVRKSPVAFSRKKCDETQNRRGRVLTSAVFRPQICPERRSESGYTQHRRPHRCRRLPYGGGGLSCPQPRKGVRRLFRVQRRVRRMCPAGEKGKKTA